VEKTVDFRLLAKIIASARTCVEADTDRDQVDIHCESVFIIFIVTNVQHPFAAKAIAFSGESCPFIVGTDGNEIDDLLASNDPHVRQFPSRGYNALPDLVLTGRLAVMYRERVALALHPNAGQQPASTKKHEYVFSRRNGRPLDDRDLQWGFRPS